MKNPTKKSIDEIIKLLTSEDHDKRMGERGMAIDPENNADDMIILTNRINDIKEELSKSSDKNRKDLLNQELNRLSEILEFLEENKC